MIGIIIPCHNSGDFIKHALKSIVDSTKENYKIIIVESESTDGTDKVVDIWAKQYENIHAFHTEKEGLITAINDGINKAKEFGCSAVYLTQDDVIHHKLFQGDWLNILRQISQVANCGAITTINGGGVSGPSYIDGLRWAGTWSLFIPMNTINEIGLFDEKFNPGCGDDIDYSYRIQRAGLNIIEAPFWVEHHRLNNHINESEEIKETHAKYFREKWKL